MNSPGSLQQAGLRYVTGSEKPSSYATHRLQPGQREILKKYYDGKLLAKMLHDGPKNPKFLDIYGNPENPFWRFDQELDELSNFNKIEHSASSALIPNSPSSLFRDIGFLIDSDQCSIEHIFPNDVCSKRLDIQKRRVEWNPNLHCYCVMNYKNNLHDIPTTYNGEYSYNSSRSVASLYELRTLMKQEPKLKAHHNEVLMTYTPNSIIGIIALQGEKKEICDWDNKVQQEAFSFQSKYRDRFRSKLPIFLYHSSTGEFIPHST